MEGWDCPLQMNSDGIYWICIVRVAVSEKVSRVVELEDEALCCKAENANDKDKLLQITKSMTECKESMQNSYQEVEDAFKVP